jgi:hypothetical protein
MVRTAADPSGHATGVWGAVMATRPLGIPDEAGLSNGAEFDVVLAEFETLKWRLGLHSECGRDGRHEPPPEAPHFQWLLPLHRKCWPAALWRFVSDATRLLKRTRRSSDVRIRKFATEVIEPAIQVAGRDWSAK